MGLDENAQIVGRQRGEIFSQVELCRQLQHPQEGTGELQVEVKKPFVALLVKGTKEVLIIEEIWTAAIGGHYGTPVGALPRHGIVNAGLGDGLVVAAVYNGHRQRLGTVGGQDDATVAESLLSVMLTMLQPSLLLGQKGKVFDRGQITRGQERSHGIGRCTSYLAMTTLERCSWQPSLISTK